MILATEDVEKVHKTHIGYVTQQTFSKGKEGIASRMVDDLLLRCPVTEDSARYFRRQTGRERKKLLNGSLELLGTPNCWWVVQTRKLAK